MANESILKPLCQQVEKEMRIADYILSRHFAVEDQPCFADLGPYFRGVHISPSSKEELPSFLQEEMGGSDALIYMRRTTCLDPTSCVVTYAHELQHVIQYRRYPKLLAVNRVLRHCLVPVPASEMDLPTEREANIVSKRIAERVCGTEIVRRFAEEQVRLMEVDRAAARKFGLDDQTHAIQQKVKWEFFLSTPSSTAYDPLPATLELVKKHKGTINFGMDVCKDDWWLGPWPGTDEGS